MRWMIFILTWKPHIDISSSAFDSRQQNFAISFRLPAQLLLDGQWKWLGPPVQQQQLPARPWRLIGGGWADPSVPVLPVPPGTAEPCLPGEPELVQPSTAGLVLHHLSCFILIWNIRWEPAVLLVSITVYCTVDWEVHLLPDIFLVCLIPYFLDYKTH